MLKQIDKMKSIITEKVLGTSIEYDVDSETFSVLFGLEIEKNKYAKNLERGWSYFKGIVASIMFDTEEEAQDYANKMLNSNLDYNDWLKHKSATKEDIPESEVDNFFEKLDFTKSLFSSTNKIIYKSKHSDDGLWTEIHFILKENRYDHDDKKWICNVIGKDNCGDITKMAPSISNKLCKVIYTKLQELNKKN